MAIKHNKVATVPDDGVSEVGTDEWNDDHDIEDNTITNDHLVGSIANSKLATDPLDRTNHTGSQPISSVSGLQAELDGKVDDSQVQTNVPSGAVFTDTTYSVGDNGLTEKNFTSTLKTKLDGVATNANNYSHPSHTGDVTGSSSLTIASGAVDLSHMSASGTKNSTTYLRGDNTWASISAGGDIQEAFSGVSSGSVNFLELTGLPNKEWYHVIGVMKGNAISTGAGFRAYAGGTLFTGYSTTVHETRGFYTDYNNDSYARFLRNSGGQAIGLNIWLMIRNGELYYHGSASGANYETNFSGSSAYNSTLDSNDGLSKIRLYNGGSAQTNWRFKVYCPA